MSTIRLSLFDWQDTVARSALKREGGKFVYKLAGISVPRGNGKSFLAAAIGLWLLITGKPGFLVLCCALDFEGAKVVLAHGKQIVRACPSLESLVQIQANCIEMPSTGSRMMVTSREHTSSRGLHPDVVLYDEGGWVRDDELFQSLLAAQAPVDDPLFLMISTMGKRRQGPLWVIKTLAEGGEPFTFWWWTSENSHPKITQEFLDHRRGVMMPAAFAREHQNQPVDAADSLTTSGKVDAAMGHSYPQQDHPQPAQSYVCFVDLGVFHDATVVAVGHEDGGIMYVDRLDTFQGTREQPVQIATIELHLLKLHQVFRFASVRVESWQGIGSVQKLEGLGMPVEIYHPTAKRNAEEWPMLHQRLEAHTIVLPAHYRLREELLNLTYEVTPHGVKVIDRGKVHQDHAVTVRGLCAMLVQPAVNWALPGPEAHGFRDSGLLNAGVPWEHLPAPGDTLAPWSSAGESKRKFDW